MNIFRIIASGKHGMREEFVTAFLSYLLSPKMDHGLGFTFLSKILTNIADKNKAAPLKDLADQFKSTLWENIFDENGNQPVVELEFKYNGGFIDIVIRCDNWFIMIENKIVQASKTKGQIKAQYDGLLEVIKGKDFGKDYKILVIYLVPASCEGEVWSVAPVFNEELDKVALREGDYKSLVSWQPINDEESVVISIVDIIREILKQESEGIIAPVSIEVRQSLLSLVDFVLREFHGFHYEKATSRGNNYKKMKVSEILNLTGDFYIGIQYGRGGTTWEAWRNPDFAKKELSVTEDNTKGWQYVPLKEFQIYAKWSMYPDNNSLEGVEWYGTPFGAPQLYRTAKWGKSKFYIGIKGGVEALKKMSLEQIKQRKIWLLRADKKSSDWISTSDFCQILEDAGWHPSDFGTGIIIDDHTIV